MPEQILPPKQQKFLGCVLTARTVEQAAKAAGFSERQCYRWLADARFDAALREARRTALRLATGQLQQAAGEAVTVLRCIALDAKQPAAARVTAASKLLDAAYRAAEVEDLTERLEAVEERLAASGTGRNGCRAPAW